MTAGFASTVDALSRAVALLLAAKLVATVLLLADRRRAHAKAWWWTTRLTPIAAVPLLIAVGIPAGHRQGVADYGALLALVVVAVVWKVWRHRARRPARCYGPPPVSQPCP